MLWNREKARYSLWLFPIGCPLFATVADKNLKRRVERISTIQSGYSTIILAQRKRTLNKNMEKNCLQEDDDGKKCLRRYMFFKKIFAEHNFSPPPGPLQKNNGLSPSVLSYSVTTFAQLRVIVPVD